MGLELVVIKHKILFSGPVDWISGAFDLLDDRLLPEAHVDVLEDRSLQKIFVDNLVFSVLLDFLQNTSSQLNLAVLEDHLPEQVQSCLCQTRRPRIFQEVAVQVVEHLFHSHHKYGELLPLLDVLLEELMAV